MKPTRRAAVLVAVLAVLLVVSLLTGSLVRSLLLEHRRQRLAAHQMQALLLADAGERLARRRLAEASDYVGERWSIAELADGDGGLVEIRITSADGDAPVRRLTIEAAFPVDSELKAVVRRERRLDAAVPGALP